MIDSQKQCDPANQPGPFVVPIFIPQAGCPHQCVFCNQRAITGTAAAMPAVDRLTEEISRFLAFRRDNRALAEIAFFGGNFLGQDPDDIQALLEIAAGFVREGKADGIRFSTRPDTIDERRLDFISPYPVRTVELGVQSMDDRVLALSRRGHSAADTVRAVRLLKQRGYKTGLQMMVGLPGEDASGAIDTARQVAALEPDFVRIYPTLVIKGSPLEQWYRSGRYDPLTLEDCIERVKALFLLFNNKNIPVARIGLQANEGLDTGRDLVAGPYHPALGQMVVSGVLFDKAAEQIASLGDEFSGGVEIRVHPRMISTLRGQKNGNIRRLKERFPHMGRISVAGDPDMEEMGVGVDTGAGAASGDQMSSRIKKHKE